MKGMPFVESLFEKQVHIKRTDIFDINVDRIEKFLTNLPANKKRKIIATADKAAEGKIKTFSSTVLDYGCPINWHYNPISGAEVDKNLKWYKIPDFDPARGDIKIIWEPSRFTHFFYFARGYLITKNKKYYKVFSNQLKSWLKNNSYSYGANYKCGQEAALRMINAIIVYSVFKSCGFDSQQDENNLYKLIEGSYKKILSNFFYAYKCIKNNHTLSEIVGLIIGAWCSKDKNQLGKSYKLLNGVIEKQFKDDGGYIQNSFNYQRFVLQLMELVLKIAAKTKLNISDDNKELIKKSALQLYQLQDISGDVPNKGANDGALIFPVTANGYRDFRPVINTIHALIGTKRLYEPGTHDEELLWFGEKDLTGIPIIETVREPAAFPDSGLYSLRDQNGFLMIVLQDHKTRPGQMDQLHIDLWHRGKNLFCDSGSYSYAQKKGLSLTAAHNTAQIDNKEQMNRYGPFLVYDWSSAENIKFDGTSFSGTMISKNGYKHTRKIKKTDTGYLIEDNISGNGKKCSFNFHTPYTVKTTNTGFKIIDNGKTLATVKTKGAIEVKKAYRSLYYLKKEEINKISVSSKIVNSRCNMRFVIILF
ncbi:MAG: hypothetical protein GX369_08410 [Euryarchaeota archaeon]|nr:hypothetical protein [Euryarchaeota archaeon]